MMDQKRASGSALVVVELKGFRRLGRGEAGISKGAVEEDSVDVWLGLDCG